MAWWGLRHFLFAFHASPLDVLCRGPEVSLSSELLAAELDRMRSWLVPEAEPHAAAGRRLMGDS